MAIEFQISIITPARSLLTGDVRSVTVPGIEGYLEIRALHAPLISELAPGELTVVDASGREIHYAVASGFLEIFWSGVNILSDAIEGTAEIDFERARAAADRARARLAGPRDGVDVARAEAALKRALNRMRLSGGHREYHPS